MTPGPPAGPGMATGDILAGRYRITRYLGGGGMGNVYAAVDTELGEPVAIKMLRRGITEDAIARFRTEVKLQRRITHKNVARIFDIGDHHGEKLLTMELVDGESLAARLERLGKLPLSELRWVARDILDGLAAAHAAGVIHRDLKPGNVLLARDGRAVIADFGIASAGRTAAGEISGTPAYMAPEQHELDGDVDARADLYAFGVMLYELATGNRPFGGTTLEQIGASKAAPPDPRAHAPELPAALVAVIQRCLAPDRAARPDSAADAAAAVERALRDAEGRATGSSVGIPLPGGQLASATVAVLPVQGAPADAYLATGLAEDLADALSRSPGLRVLPATAVRGLAATGVSAGAALGVDHIVEGSLRRSGDRLRVSVRLVAVRDGFQVWSDRRDIAEADLLATADELAEGLARALSTAAAPREEVDPRAVDVYLRARHQLRDFWSNPIEETLAMLEEAAAAAPTSPAIIGTLATARVRYWMLRGTPETEALARTTCERAMLVGPNHGETRYARAQMRINTGDVIGGAHDLGTALTLAPLLADGHYTAGLVLSEAGHVDEGRRRFRHSLELDPASRAIVDGDCARLLALEGKMDEATRILDALAVLSELPNAQRLVGLYRARLAMWFGDRMIATASVVMPGPTRGFFVDHLIESIRGMLVDGFVAEAWRAHFGRYEDPARPLRGRMVSMQILSELAMSEGHPELALDGLEKVAAAGLLDVHWLRNCPLWRPFTEHPRYGAVVAQVAGRAQQAVAALHAGMAGK